MPKRFTLREVERLLPELGVLLRDAVAQRSEYREAQQRFQAITEHVMFAGGTLVDRGDAREARVRLDQAAAALSATVEKIQKTGCALKDLDVGLVDFPSVYRGRDVFLCWKLGEPSIGYWHGVEEGFAGRKPIDDDFLEHHGWE
jgi:hypothetical protein